MVHGNIVFPDECCKVKSTIMFVLAFSSDAAVVSEKSSHWNERHVLKDKWYLQLNDDENIQFKFVSLEASAETTKVG